MKRLLLCSFVLGLAALSTLAGEWQYKTVNVASGLASVTNATVTSTSGTAFDIPANTDLAFQPTFSGANPGTSNVVYSLNLSSDTTNYSTTLPVTATVAANGTNVVTGWVVLSRTNFVGAKKGRLDSVSTTQTNAITTTSASIGYYY